MSPEQKMATALSMVEVTVGEMREKGLTHGEITCALAYHMNHQADLHIPDKTASDLWKSSLCNLADFGNK